MGRVCHHPVRPCRHPARFGHHPVRAGHRPAGPAGATWVRCGGQACRRYPRRTDPGWLSALATSPPTATQPEDPVEPSCCPIPTMQGRCPCLGSPSAGSAFLCPPNWPGQCWCSAIPAAVKRQRNGRSGDGEGSCEKNVSGLAPAGGRQALPPYQRSRMPTSSTGFLSRRSRRKGMPMSRLKSTMPAPTQALMDTRRVSLCLRAMPAKAQTMTRT